MLLVTCSEANEKKKQKKKKEDNYNETIDRNNNNGTEIIKVKRMFIFLATAWLKN